jgi:hypothetical protein
MHRSRRGWLALLGLVALDACGAGEPGPVSEEEFFTSLANIVCEGQALCCARASGGYDQQACHQQMQAYKASFQDGSARTGLVYDPQEGATCLARTRQRYTSCQASDLEPGERGCGWIYHGTKAPGEECFDPECGRMPDGTLLHCVRPTLHSTRGTCQAVSPEVAWQGRHGQEGESCVGSCQTSASGSSTCRNEGSNQAPDSPACFDTDGLYCGPDGRCIALVAEGQPCSYEQRCATGTSCNLSSEVCETGPFVGSACTAQNPCGGGTLCNTATKRCEARKPPGSSCENDGECASSMCHSGTCRSQKDLTHLYSCTP